jgi:glycine hydroxymethyltransferase
MSPVTRAARRSVVSDSVEDARAAVAARGPAPFWGPDFAALAGSDPQIAEILLDEVDRARGGLQLIASENFTSPSVLAALG